MSLYKYTAFINFKGVIQGKIAINFDENVANLISHEFPDDNMAFEERNLYIEDSVAENLNIILGNSIKALQERT